MKYSREVLLFIIENSSNIFERLDSSIFDYCSKKQDALIQSRLKKWCEISCEGNWDKFQFRLSKLGVTIAAAEKALGEVKYKADVELPQWAFVLEEILMDYEAQNPDCLMEYVDINNQTAFHELFYPYLHWIEKKFNRLLDDCSSIACRNACRNLKYQLLQQLLQLHTKVLAFEFSAFRAIHGSPFDRFDVDNTHTAAELYKAFIESMYQGGYIELAYRYPVLVRLSITLLVNCLNNTSEVINRLLSDKNKIKDIFNNGEPFTKVADIDSYKSDFHNCGKTVTILTFQNGMKLVYKPRDLSPEKAFFHFAEWINNNINIYSALDFSNAIDTNSMPLFKTLKILDSNSYGWIEYVEHKSCVNNKTVQNYYFRAGALLALMHVLNAKDCHMENIVSHGEYPVPIDLECIMHQSTEKLSNKFSDADAIFYESDFCLTSTGLLPGQLLDNNKASIDIAGFGTAGNDKRAVSKLKWINNNTNSMMLKEIELIRKHTNIPSIGSAVKYPEYYKEYIKNGFRYLYEFFMNRSINWTCDNSPLAYFKNLSLRFILRASSNYAAILSKSEEPINMRSGIARSLELDVLCKYNNVLKNAEFLWILLNEELKSLEQLDIPYIKVSSNPFYHKALTINNKQIFTNILDSSLDLVIKYIQSLNIEDLYFNLSIIENNYSLLLSI